MEDLVSVKYFPSKPTSWGLSPNPLDSGSGPPCPDVITPNSYPVDWNRSKHFNFLNERSNEEYDITTTLREQSLLRKDLEGGLYTKSSAGVNLFRTGLVVILEEIRSISNSTNDTNYPFFYKTSRLYLFLGYLVLPIRPLLQNFEVNLIEHWPFVPCTVFLS